MIKVLAYGFALALAAPVLASDMAPSGVEASLHETIFEPFGVTAATAKTLRLRYVAPLIADKQAYGFETIEADFAWYCARDGLEFIANSAPMVEQVIVSISSEPVVFGETAPNVVQYFDSFGVEASGCIWEGL